MRGTPNFDRIARAYCWLETIMFGKKLSQCRCSFLDELRSCRNALVIGDGDGRFTARLLERNRTIHVDAVDSSSAMLRVLVRNAGRNAHRVSTHHSDAREFTPPDPPYDLIVTHFFLDCLTSEEVTAIAERIRKCAGSSSRWIASEFAIPDNWFGTIVARPVVTGLYLAFGLLTGLRVFRLPDYREAMARAGFKVSSVRPFIGGMLVSEMWIRATGDDVAFSPL
jgi:ubiquinone/menaquinone biosynthesis C-methylase UbiE